MGLSDKLLRFVDCKILRGHRLIEEDLWIHRGKVVNPDEVLLEKKMEDEKIPVKGAIVAPGFIEVQLHGGFGIDMTHDYVYNPFAAEIIAKKIPQHGVTAFCPSFVSTSIDVYEQLLKKLKPKPGGRHGASILGAHLVGPFINPELRGNHNLKYLAKYTHGLQSLNTIYSNLETIKIVTLAPELPGSLETIQTLSEKGIIVSIGHSMASFEEAEKAHLKGAYMISHIFNAMRPFHHRDPGLLALLTSKYANKIFFSLVPDGYHMHPTTIKIAYRLNPQRVIISTLGTSALGSQQSRVIHHIGDKAIEARGRAVHLAEQDIISGGVTPMIQCVKIFYDSTECTIIEALEAASLHAAELLKIDKAKGNLNFGSDADFIVTNEHFELLSTWIAGKAAYVAYK